MRDMIIGALKSKLLGDVNSHIANIEVMMTNPVGVGDHPTIVDTIDKELSALEHANGKLNNLIRFFERREEDESTKKDKKQGS
tara:strand:+ start:338 stop:586 length:249 start_codon:yes stop_codon:yes gene_type:complete